MNRTPTHITESPIKGTKAGEGERRGDNLGNDDHKPKRKRRG